MKNLPKYVNKKTSGMQTLHPGIWACLFLPTRKKKKAFRNKPQFDENQGCLIQNQNYMEFW